jgi:hypothetical protein
MQCNFDPAMKVAAKMKAYETFCQRHQIPDPDFDSPEVDPLVVELHGQALALAWAEQHWNEFLDQIDDEDSQFLIRLNRCRSCSGDDQVDQN